MNYCCSGMITAFIGYLAIAPAVGVANVVNTLYTRLSSSNFRSSRGAICPIERNGEGLLVPS